MQVQAAQLHQAEAEWQVAPQPKRRALHLLERSRVCHHLWQGDYIGQQSPGKPRVCCHCPCAHAVPAGMCLCHLQMLLLLWFAIVTECHCGCCCCYCCMWHIHCTASSDILHTGRSMLDILHTGRSMLQQQAGCAGHKLIDSESYAQDGSCHHHPELAVIRFCLRHMCSVKQLLLHATGGR